MSFRNLNARSFPQVAKKHCRVCAKLCPGARRTICSDECQRTMQFMTSATTQREEVRKRDRGKCCLCGHVGYWEMDHIIPVCEGGGLKPGMTIEEAMANLRTLCVKCHKTETGKLRRRLAGKAE